MNTTLVVALILLASRPSPCPEPTEISFGTKLANIFGVSASPEARGPADVMESRGNVVVKLGDFPKSLTTSGDFRSPVFSPISVGDILAIKGDEEIVRLRLEGAGNQTGEHLAKVPGAQRIVGMLNDDANLLVILADQGGQQVAQLLCVSGRRLIAAQNLSKDDPTRLLARLSAGSRKYSRPNAPATVVATQRKNNQIDVFRDDVTNLTNCAEMAKGHEILECSQGALAAATSELMVFISTTRPKPAAPGGP